MTRVLGASKLMRKLLAADWRSPSMGRITEDLSRRVRRREVAKLVTSTSSRSGSLTWPAIHG